MDPFHFVHVYQCMYTCILASMFSSYLMVRKWTASGIEGGRGGGGKGIEGIGNK